ncbi:glycoside hydrolase [Leeuwenhoekiella sp. W20_SRS_FM14]|uniref:glycoside hydrolase n=1 Tax=Leeuwenhoekiella sp. W20_SRS_FM14 TaxID=3240270 RepID=UPI003F9AE211
MLKRQLHFGLITKNILGVFLCFFGLNLQGQELKVVIDDSVIYQEIDGFGASDAWRCQFIGANWPAAKKEQMADWLFSKEVDTSGNPKGIALSIWRFNIGAGTAEQGRDSQIRNEWRRAESFIDTSGIYDWNKQAGQQWFLRQAKDAGVEQFLAFLNAPPVIWSLNGKGYAATKDGELNLKPRHFEDYTDFMIAFLKHFKTEGIEFDYISPVNEPQWDWEKPNQEGTPATNSNIATLVKSLNTKLLENKLKTTITITEAGELEFLYEANGKPNRGNQIEAFYTADSVNYLGDLENLSASVSGHSYFTTWPVSKLIETRQKLNKSLTQNNVDYWQSEFCILENTEDIGSGNTRDLGMATALYVARVIHADLTLSNAKSWQWWTAITGVDYKDGLIYIDTGNSENRYDRTSLKTDGDFHDSKLLWALGNYSRFIRPGFQRISASYSTQKSLEEQYSDLMVSAYKNPETGALVLVLINYADQEQHIALDASKVVFKHAYETSETQNLQHRKLTGNQLKLAPRSITTLTSESLHPGN